MARRPKYSCRHRGCPALVDGPGYCPAHASEAGWKPDCQRGNRHQRGYGSAWARIATIEGDRQAELQAASDAAYQASEKYRSAEQSWVQKMNEVTSDVEIQRQAAARAAVRAAAADATAGRLRGQLDSFIAAIRRRAAEDPGPAGSSTATGPALDLLAELLRRADARAGELARYADDARIAGQACERTYDALALEPWRPGGRSPFDIFLT